MDQKIIEQIKNKHKHIDDQIDLHSKKVEHQNKLKDEIITIYNNLDNFFNSTYNIRSCFKKELRYNVFTVGYFNLKEYDPAKDQNRFLYILANLIFFKKYEKHSKEFNIIFSKEDFLVNITDLPNFRKDEYGDNIYCDKFGLKQIPLPGWVAYMLNQQDSIMELRYYVYDIQKKLLQKLLIEYEENLYNCLYSKILKEKLSEDIKKHTFVPLETIDIDENPITKKCRQEEEKIPLLFILQKQDKYICYYKEQIEEILINKNNYFYNNGNKYVIFNDDINIKYDELFNILLSDSKIFYLLEIGELNETISYNNIITNKENDISNETKIIYSIRLCNGDNCVRTNPPKKWFFGLF